VRNDELREQIEALRLEVRALGDSFISLRQEDIRRVFVDQVRPVLKERIDRTLSEVPPFEMSMEERRACQRAINAWLEKALHALDSDDRAALPRFLERRGGRSVVRPWEGGGLHKLMEDLEAQLLSYHRSYDAVLRTTHPGVEGTTPLQPKTALDPAAAEAVLGPLSNALRIDLMQRLSRQDDGLAALSRAAGLQKGHLQFHLKVLMDGGYILQDRKSRMYSITTRGERALDGLAAIVEAIGTQ
jgi:DNA-binding transcriptional ArsR family regulator